MSQHDSIGGDSFLDIVANLVGILIILVVVIGAQAATVWHVNEVSTPLAVELQSVEQETVEKFQEAANLQIENAELHEKIAYEQRMADQLSANRHLLLTNMENLRRELQSRKQVLTADQQQHVNLQSEIQLLSQQIQQVRYEFSALDQHLEPMVETIPHYPTPIAKTVFSDEIHFQITDGQIAYVPLNELVAAMKNEWQLKAKTLEVAENTWETVGPIEKFRLQYQLEAIPTERRMAPQFEIQFRQFVLQPAGRRIGEDSHAALQANSKFQQKLSRLQPGKTTVSLWVYPDGYQDLKRIRQWLRERGYQTASWPLDHGWPISGGPNGFRTTTN